MGMHQVWFSASVGSAALVSSLSFPETVSGTTQNPPNNNMGVCTGIVLML